MSIVLFENKKDCCGCWGCYNVCPKSAIEMIDDGEGFKYPVINNDICVECGLCQKVCPIKTANERIESEKAKKHIGIINLQFTQNYGAVIAAAVLEDVVKKIVPNEYIVSTINYQPSKYFSSRYQRIKDEIKNAGGFRLYVKYLKKIYSTKETQDLTNQKIRNQRFSIFRDTYINESKIISDASNINSTANYSAFITGSDVVWAPKRIDNFRADGYFLKFANSSQLKIAYAPSLDSYVNSKLESLKSYYAEGIKHLDYISVREKSNVDFIQKLTENKVYECCDPTFLVESNYYDDMIDKAQVHQEDKPYIYVYILEINNEIVKYANKLAKEKNLKICYYSENHRDYSCESEDCASDGPFEFLYRIKNAEYVLTNSFHCVVFSLLFKKKFLSFTRNKISIKTHDLLKKFDLDDRLVLSSTPLISIDKRINFDRVESIIKKMKDESLGFLTDSLREFM